MIDVEKLRALLANHALPWTHGETTGIIETTQADGIHGRTCFVPEDDEAPYVGPRPVDASVIAEARLAVAAVNALPDLLAVYEAATKWRDRLTADTDDDAATIVADWTRLAEAVDATRRKP